MCGLPSRSSSGDGGGWEVAPPEGRPAVERSCWRRPEHVRLLYRVTPTDGVPYWDTRARAVADGGYLIGRRSVQRLRAGDSSAAAIAARAAEAGRYLEKKVRRRGAYVQAD